MADPIIEEGRHAATAFNGPGGSGFQNTGRANIYTCTTCSTFFVTVDREPGVTPYTTRCLKDGCGGTAVSSGYRSNGQPLSHEYASAASHEWVRPETLDGLSQAVIDHIRKGGLIMRKIAA